MKALVVLHRQRLAVSVTDSPWASRIMAWMARSEKRQPTGQV
jgi:hypothetical protein